MEDGGLVPDEAVTCSFGYNRVPVSDNQRFLQNRVRPVHVFEPVRSRGYRQHGGTDFWKKMTRHFDAGRLRQSCCSNPSRNSTDALQIGHNEVGSMRVQGDLHLMRAVEVLSDLDRRF